MMRSILMLEALEMQRKILKLLQGFHDLLVFLFIYCKYIL